MYFNTKRKKIDRYPHFVDFYMYIFVTFDTFLYHVLH